MKTVSVTVHNVVSVVKIVHVVKVVLVIVQNVASVVKTVHVAQFAKNTLIKNLVVSAVVNSTVNL